MDPHDETMIQNEEATLSLSEDAVSPPKKRGKHVSDSDSPEKKHILDVGLSEQELTLTSDEWSTMFEFIYYKAGPSEEALRTMYTKCENELKAVSEKYRKGKDSSDNYSKELKKEKPCSESSDSSSVIETIEYELKLMRKEISMASEMLPLFWSAMDDYKKFRDGALWELKVAQDEYYKKVEELAGMPDVDKLMGVLLRKVNNFELIEECSGLTREDILRITFYLWTRKGIEFDIGEVEADINIFYESGMKEVVDRYKGLVEHIHSLMERFKTAAAIVNKDRYPIESKFFDQVGSLVSGLQMAGVYSRIIDGLLELLGTKDDEGYDLDDFFEALRATDIDGTFVV